jgi:hypothetical protein
MRNGLPALAILGWAGGAAACPACRPAVEALAFDGAFAARLVGALAPFVAGAAVAVLLHRVDRRPR